MRVQYEVCKDNVYICKVNTFCWNDISTHMERRAVSLRQLSFFTDIGIAA